MLELARKGLGLDEAEAEEILQTARATYQQRQTNLEHYRQTLIDEWAGQDELRADQWTLLQQVQAALGISDGEVEQVTQKVLAERATELQQVQKVADTQAQEAERQRQQEAEERLKREATHQQGTSEAKKQQEAENLQRKQDQEAAERQKVLEAQKQQEVEKNQGQKQENLPIQANLKLQTFSFEVVLLDDAGKERKRTTEQAQYFAETLAHELDLQMVSIPSGSFYMGSRDGEGNSDERPQHLVNIAPFYMGKFPVTQAQWRVVAGFLQIMRSLKADPSNFKGATLPVEQVSWHEAVEFCARLSCKAGQTYRLPSEAEWEYACRAKTNTSYHFGNKISRNFVNYSKTASVINLLVNAFTQQPSEVGSLQVTNHFGLYDMHGNVNEWCLDLWHADYNRAPLDGSAWVTKSDNNSRLQRGGSWFTSDEFCRSANCKAISSNHRDYRLGFRVVCIPS